MICIKMVVAYNESVSYLVRRHEDENHFLIPGHNTFATSEEFHA